VSESAIAAALVEAIAAAAREQAGADTVLASFSLEILAPGAPARAAARIERKTRTLVFASADAFDAEGARIAAASAVHRIFSLSP
jgi:hypothetical protein